mmetsp:Transcript_25139/g.63457  ORF Transcript_25139/g.63457 Transcript_25139/m.63457 type:complete len:207 (-) Transcript_25139:91-711(-)
MRCSTPCDANSLRTGGRGVLAARSIMVRSMLDSTWSRIISRLPDICSSLGSNLRAFSLQEYRSSTSTLHEFPFPPIQNGCESKLPCSLSRSCIPNSISFSRSSAIGVCRSMSESTMSKNFLSPISTHASCAAWLPGRICVAPATYWTFALMKILYKMTGGKLCPPKRKRRRACRVGSRRMDASIGLILRRTWCVRLSSARHTACFK